MRKWLAERGAEMATLDGEKSTEVAFATAYLNLVQAASLAGVDLDKAVDDLLKAKREKHG